MKELKKISGILFHISFKLFSQSSQKKKKKYLKTLIFSKITLSVIMEIGFFLLKYSKSRFIFKYMEKFVEFLPEKQLTIPETIANLKK